MRFIDEEGYLCDKIRGYKQPFIDPNCFEIDSKSTQELVESVFPIYKDKEGKLSHVTTLKEKNKWQEKLKTKEQVVLIEGNIK
jgi:hypothetical protein